MKSKNGHKPLPQLLVPQLFTTQETAKMLKLSPATLEIWRSEGGHGLPYLKLAGGAVRYRLEDIRDFVDHSMVKVKRS